MDLRMHQLGSPSLRHPVRYRLTTCPRRPALAKQALARVTNTQEAKFILNPGGPVPQRHDVRLPFPLLFVSPRLPNSTNTFFGVAVVAFEYDRIEAVSPGRAAIFRQLKNATHRCGKRPQRKKAFAASMLEHHLQDDFYMVLAFTVRHQQLHR